MADNYGAHHVDESVGPAAARAALRAVRDEAEKASETVQLTLVSAVGPESWDLHVMTGLMPMLDAPAGRIILGDVQRPDAVLSWATEHGNIQALGNGTYTVRVDGREVARADVVEDGKGDYLTSVHVEDDYKRQGIATALYDFIEADLGRSLRPSPTYQTPDAQAFWRSRTSSAEEETGDVVVTLPKSFGLEAWKPYVHNVWVADDMRGKGVARILYDVYRRHVAAHVVTVGPFSPAGYGMAQSLSDRVSRAPPKSWRTKKESVLVKKRPTNHKLANVSRINHPNRRCLASLENLMATFTTSDLVTAFMEEYQTDKYGVMKRLSERFGVKAGTLTARLNKLRLAGVAIPELPRGRPSVDINVADLNELVAIYQTDDEDSEDNSGHNGEESDEEQALKLAR